MRRLMVAALVLAVGSLASSARAAEDPTGTWKWKMKFRDQEREMTLKLKLEGEKLTGAMLGREGQETPIEKATYKDGKLSFEVTRQRGDQKVTSKYNGTLKGDTITGKIESPGRDGQPQTRDWEAKRATEKK